MRGDRFVFAYAGAFRDDHAWHLVTLGERAAACAETTGHVRGRLAFIMVEAYQNILRHRAEVPEDLADGDGRSLFLLRCNDGDQQVVAVNPVRKDQVPGLVAALEPLKRMDAIRLKDMLIRGLEKEQEEKRRGAGLGLIEMTRRSGGGLDYSIKELTADHDLFTLAVRPGDARGQETVSGAMAIHALVAQHGISLVHAGAMAGDVRDAVRGMLEDGADDGGHHRGEAFIRALALLDGAPGPSGPGDGSGVRYLCVGIRKAGQDELVVGRVMAARTAWLLAEAAKNTGSEEVAVLPDNGDDAVLLVKAL